MALGARPDDYKITIIFLLWKQAFLLAGEGVPRAAIRDAAPSGV